jgi:hypothetical protein
VNADPPDFLWTLLALANLMRLSSLQAANAVVYGAKYRKSGSACPWDSEGVRTSREPFLSRDALNAS